MDATTLDFERLLQRIGYAGAREPNLDTLAGLQRSFLHAVPFENLDIHWGREITVSPERAYDKIVGEGRGGFCFECNGLFARLLESLGFDVTIASARMTITETPTPDFAHMTLLVELEDGPYMVDVGNGQSGREPLRLDGANECASEGITYRIAQRGDDLALMFRKDGDDWLPRFLFTPQPRVNEQFAGMCTYLQTSPESIFVQGRLVTLATENGRKTLLPEGLRIETTASNEEIPVESEDDYRNILTEHFGITVPDWAQ